MIEFSESFFTSTFPMPPAQMEASLIFHLELALGVIHLKLKTTSVISLSHICSTSKSTR